MPESKAIEKDIEIISPELFGYIRVAETTRTCECPEERTPEEIQQCWDEFMYQPVNELNGHEMMIIERLKDERH